jgi:hypothetical protein
MLYSVLKIENYSLKLAFVVPVTGINYFYLLNTGGALRACVLSQHDF